MPRDFLGRIPLLKTVWREVFHRVPWHKGKAEEFEQLFTWSEDPWNFRTSRYDQERYEALLRIVATYPHGSILEIGCAEGMFTSRLTSLATEVVAIDVSPAALARAELYAPQAAFVRADLRSFTSERPFDVVLCAETLYYVDDIPGAIKKLSQLGRTCIVSYNHRHWKKLDPFVRAIPGVEYRRFSKRYGLLKRSFSVAVWKNTAAGAA